MVFHRRDVDFVAFFDDQIAEADSNPVQAGCRAAGEKDFLL